MNGSFSPCRALLHPDPGHLGASVPPLFPTLHVLLLSPSCLDGKTPLIHQGPAVGAEFVSLPLSYPCTPGMARGDAYHKALSSVSAEFWRPKAMFCLSLNFPGPATRPGPSQMFNMSGMDERMSGWADGRPPRPPSCNQRWTLRHVGPGEECRPGPRQHARQGVSTVAEAGLLSCFDKWPGKGSSERNAHICG